MGKIQFKRGLQATKDKSTIELSAGQPFFTKDTGKLYIAKADKTAIKDASLVNANDPDAAHLSTDNEFTGINTFKGTSNNSVEIRPTGISIHSHAEATTPSVVLYSDSPERLCVKSSSSTTGGGYIQFPTIDDSIAGVETVALQSDIPVIKANPTATGAATLTKLLIGSTVYNLPSSSGSGVTSVSFAGSGNAVTSASISGNTLTLTRGSTFLTSHQSLDNCAKLNAVNTFLATTKFKANVEIGGTSEEAGLKVLINSTSENSDSWAKYGYSSIQYSPAGVTKSYNLDYPTKAGTIALTADIPTVVANPSTSGTVDLTKITVGSTTYNIPSGGGSSPIKAASLSSDSTLTLTL